MNHRLKGGNIQLKPKEIILDSSVELYVVFSGVLDIAPDTVLGIVDLVLEVVLEVVLDVLVVAPDGLLNTVAEKLDGGDTVEDVLVSSVGSLDFKVDEPDTPAA